MMANGMFCKVSKILMGVCLLAGCDLSLGTRWKKGHESSTTYPDLNSVPFDREGEAMKAQESDVQQNTQALEQMAVERQTLHERGDALRTQAFLGKI